MSLRLIAQRVNLGNLLNISCFSNLKAVSGVGSNRFIHLTDIQNGLKSKFRAPTLVEMKKRVKKMKEKGIYPVTIRSQFIEWNYDAELFAFGKRFNENFDEALIREAFTDLSYIFKETKRLEDLGLDETKLQMKSNRDLAEAGRALITTFTTKYVRAVCSLLPEEGVMSFVEYLSSDELLSQIAHRLGFRDLILTQEYPPNHKTFATSFCAVVGCLNASSGVRRAERFVLDFVVAELVGKDVWDMWKVEEPLELLRSILLSNGRGEPEPRLMGDIGRTTVEAVFHVGIYDQNKEFVGSGFGEDIDMATRVAAYDSLSRLFDQSASRTPMTFRPIDLPPPSKTEPNPSVSEWRMQPL